MSRHFIFDLGNVLVDFDSQILYRAVAKDSGRPVEEISMGLQDGDMLIAVETGEITDQQFIDYVNDAKGLSWTVEDLIRIWQKMFSINEGGYSIFRRLKERGHSVHFLSNLAWHNMEAIRRNWPGFFEQSDSNFFSYELGLHKPDERIYRAVLDRLSVKPEACFFLDDKWENVEGARALGIKAHRFSVETIDVLYDLAEEFSKK